MSDVCRCLLSLCLSLCHLSLCEPDFEFHSIFDRSVISAISRSLISPLCLSVAAGMGGGGMGGGGMGGGGMGGGVVVFAVGGDLLLGGIGEYLCNSACCWMSLT